ncbi:MAG: hypothetical protein OXH52_08350 [Gammaproteobacteria bacterium]|nr:hypothetical protein [Gammaproteobacteria bacterium]
MEPSVIDTLRYADRLKAAGVETRQAEAMARAFNDELAVGVATKEDLDGAVGGLKGDLDRAVGGLKGDLDRAVGELKGEMTKLHARVDSMEVDMEAGFEVMDARFKAMDASIHALSGRFESQGRYVFLVLGLIAALGLYNAVAPRLPASSEAGADPAQSTRAQAAGTDAAPVRGRLGERLIG